MYKHFRSFILLGALMFPLLSLKAETQLDRLITYGQQTHIEATEWTHLKENSMQSICVRVKLKEGMLEEVRQWFHTLMNRSAETLESLQNEGVIVESTFLDRQPSGDFLIYYLRAQDIEKAMDVFQNSSLTIDAYHKECWSKYCEKSTHLEQLFDLDTIKLYQSRS